MGVSMENSNLINILIGCERRYKLRKGNKNFTQINFIKQGHYEICSQGTLSRIEKGISVNYLDTLHHLIEKLGYTFSENNADYDAIKKLVLQYLFTLQKQDLKPSDLIEIQSEVTIYLKKFESVFYLYQILTLLNVSMKYYLNNELPDIDLLERLISCSTAFSMNTIIILFDIVIWTQEISPYRSRFINEFLTKVLPEINDLAILLNSIILIRNGDFIKAIRKLDLIKITNHNDLFLFRIKRLELLIEINITRIENSSNFNSYYTFIDNTLITIFEKAKFLHLLGISEFYRVNFKQSLTCFIEAANLYPSISILSMAFVVEILKDIDIESVTNYLEENYKYLEGYSNYYKHQHQFFQLLYSSKDSNIAANYLIKYLKSDIARIKNKNIPYLFYENHILEIANKSKSYKLLYQFLKDE